MVEDNPTENTIVPTYEQFSEIKPPRVDAATPNDDLNVELSEHGGSLKKRTLLSPKMSDFQIVDRRLFPILKEACEWLQSLMVARVFPDEVIALKNIIVKHLLGTFKEISFAEAYCIAEVAVTVPLDSEGRIDIARVFVKAGEMSEEKEKNKI